METGSLIAVFILGAILGGFIGVKWHQSSVLKKKRELKARRKARQRKILEHMRIEVKYNTIRLKKEEKRLALSKELGEMDLLFKNYKRRLYKVSDKDLLSSLQDFYQDILELTALNKSFIELITKGFSSSSISDAAKVDIKNACAGMILSMVQVHIEKGSNLVSYIEQTIVTLLPTEFCHSPQERVELIKTIGVEHCIMSTDLGQYWNIYPAEGFRFFMAILLRNGLTPADIEVMAKKNPSLLLGID